MSSSDEVLKKRFAHESEYNGHREKGVFSGGAVYGHRDALKKVREMLEERERIIQVVMLAILDHGEKERYLMRLAEVARMLKKIESI